MPKELIYAIDFGTSNSLLAAANRQSSLAPIEIDETGQDKSILRSLMYFPKHGEARFGQSAIQSYLDENAEGRFIRSIKKYLPMGSFVGTHINGKSYSLEDLIGRFLREMKSRADLFFGADVDRVVLGRPAKFSLSDTEDKLAEHRLQQAAMLAGFKEIQFFPEPLAAAYSYKKEILSEKLILVVDLGGGTSDFTVIKIGPRAFQSTDVLSIGGISIAGDSLDSCIMTSKIAPHFGSKIRYRFPMSTNVMSMPASLRSQLSSPADITLMTRSGIVDFIREVKSSTLKPQDEVFLDQLLYLIKENLGFSLFEKIEYCKRGLCETDQHLFEFLEEEIDIQENISSTEFKDFTSESIQSIFNTLDEVLNSAGVSFSDIDSICCTGGTSKVPSIKEGLLKRFGAEKIHSFRNFHSVIHGLAEKASEWQNK